MLAREFISSSLYAGDGAYFNSSQRVFQSAQPQSIPFRACKDRTDYRERVSQLYNDYTSCWVTPVELFKPFYAQAIARWILETRKADFGPDSVPGKVAADEDGVGYTEAELAEQQREEMEAARLTNLALSKLAPAKGSKGGRSSAPILPPPRPLRIIEMGGGNGTCAAGILDYLQKHYPALYAQTHYTIVELSEVCAKRQRECLHAHMRHHLGQSASDAHPLSISHSSPRCETKHMSIIDWRELVSDPSLFVIGLEVLDNMPHDRIRAVESTVVDPSGGGGAKEIAQVHVFSGAVAGGDANASRYTGVHTKLEYHERLAPVSDPWIAEYCKYLEEIATLAPPDAKVDPWRKPRPETQATADELRAVYYATLRSHLLGKFVETVSRITRSAPMGQGLQSSGSSEWLPTTALQLLHILRHYLPNHHVLLADFSMLPGTVSGRLGPVVSAKGAETGGKARDYKSYLVKQGAADIFFPTDFAALHYTYQRVCMDRAPAECVFEGNGERADVPAVPASTQPRAAAATTAQSVLVPGAKRNHPRVLTTYEFMRRYARGYEYYTTTQEGWSPMHRDWVNMAFFVA